jgi:glycosyltransferase involved in cell wall biosynthesis
MSLKRGLPAFVYREIENLIENKFNVFIYSTKYGKGIYNPPADYKIEKLSKLKIFTSLIYHLVSHPLVIISLFYSSVKTKTLVDFVIALQYSRQLKKDKIDVIHAVEGLHSFSIAYYCQRIYPIKNIVTIYGDALYIHPNKQFLKKSLDSADLIFTVADYNKQIIQKEFAQDENKVFVRRLPFDYKKYTAKNKISILITGQFAQRKGHEILFKAVKLLNNKNIEIWVVGIESWGDTDGVNIRQMINDLEITDQVVLWGALEEQKLRILYEKADIFCLPSRFYRIAEGLPTVIIEAMSYEKPVISTKHAGIPEVLSEILVDENDINGLAKAIETMIKRKDDWKTMGSKNREIVKELYCKENINKFERKIEQLIDGK